ncbi:MAG: alanine--tRNA ligase, partial [Leptolyngbyaceae bacterium]|nr:alanine--tRNA ligase [Leptolyngbyaceae bacterium]
EKVFPNVRERQAVIKSELKREEAQFLKTLAKGEKLLEQILATKPDQISGQDAFMLYDTHGFPLELTQEIAEEHGLTVDVDGFEVAMAEQVKGGKEAHETIDLTIQGSLDQLAGAVDVTEFIGYSHVQSSAKVEAVLVEGYLVDAAKAGDKVQVILDKTPFYGESGGQVGDRGYLSGNNVVIRIEDVRKESDFFIHIGTVERGEIQEGAIVTAQIDRACRRRAQANHSATHLLQAALQKIVDPDVSQAGSLVDFDRLRFDFNCSRALTPADVEQVEALVNTWVAEAHDAKVAVMPIAEAKAKGATAMFGEKYGDQVRVIDFPGVSMELCGGTHVANTAEIGAFKIIAETGISAGVRRIEAVAGPAILTYLKVRDQVVKELGDRFKVQPEEVVGRVDAIQAELKDTQKQLEAVKAELAIAKSEQLLDTAETIGDYRVLVANLGEMDANATKTAAERLLQKLGTGGAVVLGAIPGDGKVSLVAAFSPEVNQAGLQAGKFIGAIAKICGGGGGGRPNLAQAGGRDGSKLPEALAQAKADLSAALA